MARYLVTGAVGFIASRVSEMLLQAGHTVVGVDNMNHAYDVRMKEYRLKRLLDYPQFLFRKIDVAVRDEVSPLEALGPFSAIFNLAARAGVRQAVENPWVYVDTNIIGTLNMLDFSCRAQIPKFILASTSSIYGANAPLPTPETADSDHPLQPYAASKKGAEAMCYAYHHLYGIDVTIFRYFTVYGPAGRPDMVMFRFTKWITEGQTLKLNGDGEQTRGFTYVDDIARGTILGLKPLGYEVINLGGHETISINTLIRMLEGLIGRQARVEHLPFNPADMLANHADVRKAGELLGWKAQFSLQSGVQRLVDWYLAERSWAQQIETN
jgi:nucleoside-diphosphate-sugar epimerase